MSRKLRAKRPDRDSDRDSGRAPARTLSDVELLDLRAWRLRRERDEKTQAGLLRIKRRLENYEPWQRGLLQLACRWRDKSAADELAAKARAASTRERARQAARRRRAGEPNTGLPGHSGRPRTAKDGLLYAAARAHTDFGVTDRAVAEFLVNVIATKYYLPPALRRQLVGTASVGQIASRLRQVRARRLPPA